MAKPVSIVLLVGIGALGVASPVTPQESLTADDISRIAAVHRAVSAVSEALREDLWPNFHPNDGPVLYTGLGGGVLMGWQGQLPEGFVPIAALDGAAWSPHPAYGALIPRGTTFTSVDSTYSLPTAVALAVHERFHGYQREAARAGKAIGRRERPASVRLYPVFDTTNASLLAREGRALREGLDADEQGLPQAIAEFLHTRASRRAYLPTDISEWERLLERSEGLAEYVGMRTLRWLAAEDYGGWRRMAELAIWDELRCLTELARVGCTSPRYRFYVTGAAQALLLDRVAPGWKHRMVATDSVLEDLLAASIGPEYVVEPLGAAEGTTVPADVHAFLQQLAREGEARIAPILSTTAAKIRVEVDGLGGICELDPLNVRHLVGNRVLHPEFVGICSADPTFTVQFRGPTVEDFTSGVFTFAAGAAADIDLAANGVPTRRDTVEEGRLIMQLSLQGPSFSIEADRAWVRWTGDTWIVRLRP